jgi:acetyl esterase/lipase
MHLNRLFMMLRPCACLAVFPAVDTHSCAFWPAIVPVAVLSGVAAPSSTLAQQRALPEPPEASERATAYRDLAYVPDGHARQKLDLYVPDGRERLPLIIWVHGGVFRVGSKEDYVPLRCFEAGYAVASIGYRLSQHAIVPAQIEDAKAAVRWLRAHAGTYHPDPGRFEAWGASAGGHLVAMLGTMGDTASFETATYDDVSSRVQAVVDHFGPANFMKIDEQCLPEGQVHNAPNSPESQLIGGPIQSIQIAPHRPIQPRYVSKGDPTVSPRPW